jgi:hypothetical protein
MVKFTKYFNERKQRSTLYHFTTAKSLMLLITGNKDYKLEEFEFFAYNDRFSCTRDGCLAQNILSKDINISKGYIVRIDLDGEKISDNFKINPINGYDDNADKGNKIGKDYEEQEEVIKMKFNKFAKGKTFKAKNYIKKIVLHNDILSNPDFDLNLFTELCNKLQIQYEFVRKFNKFLEESVNTNLDFHELEIVY